MPINPNIPLGVQTAQMPNPLESYGKVMSIKSMMQQRELNDEKLRSVQLANEEAEIERQEQDIIQKAYGEVEGDIEKLPGVLAGRVRPNTIYTLTDKINAAKKSVADRTKTELENNAAKNARLRGIWMTVRDAKPEFREAVYQAGRQQAMTEGLTNADSLPEMYPGDEQFGHIGNLLATDSKLTDEAIAAKNAESARMQAEAAQSRAETGAATERRVSTAPRQQQGQYFTNDSGEVSFVPNPAVGQSEPPKPVVVGNIGKGRTSDPLVAERRQQAFEEAERRAFQNIDKEKENAEKKIRDERRREIASILAKNGGFATEEDVHEAIRTKDAAFLKDAERAKEAIQKINRKYAPRLQNVQDKYARSIRSRGKQAEDYTVDPDTLEYKAAAPANGGATQRPRAVNPKTGETVEFDGKQWVPVQ
jgi:hypothetical protein